VELEEEEEEDECAELEPPNIMATLALPLVLTLLCCCGPCCIGFCVLFKIFVVPLLRERLKAMADAASAAAEAEKPEAAEDDEEEKEEESHADLVNSFLDNMLVKGIDDSEELEINPVLKYVVQEEKRAAARAAAERAGATGGPASPQAGVPGAIAKLNLRSHNKVSDDADERKKQKKTIEIYLSKRFEADVSYATAPAKHLAGSDKITAFEMATRSANDHAEADREARIQALARQSRAAMNAYALSNPQGVGSLSNKGRPVAAVNATGGDPGMKREVDKTLMKERGLGLA
jgi:hypothetical protein